MFALLPRAFGALARCASRAGARSALPHQRHRAHKRRRQRAPLTARAALARRCSAHQFNPFSRTLSHAVYGIWQRGGGAAFCRAKSILRALARIARIARQRAFSIARLRHARKAATRRIRR